MYLLQYFLHAETISEECQSCFWFWVVWHIIIGVVIFLNNGRENFLGLSMLLYNILLFCNKKSEQDYPDVSLWTSHPYMSYFFFNPIYQYWLLDGMLRLSAVLLIVPAAVSVRILYERLKQKLLNATATKDQISDCLSSKWSYLGYWCGKRDFSALLLL